jgi:hypothetical protein
LPWVAVLGSVAAALGLVAKECRIADKKRALKINLLSAGGIVAVFVIGFLLVTLSVTPFGFHTMGE